MLGGSLSARRAWIEIVLVFKLYQLLMSLSARRAWIEILTTGTLNAEIIVALRKESVDRNLGRRLPVVVLRLSLSARRAWIEI